MPPSALTATGGDIKSADGGAGNASRLTPSDRGSVRNRVALLINRGKVFISRRVGSRCSAQRLINAIRRRNRHSFALSLRVWGPRFRRKKDVWNLPPVGRRGGKRQAGGENILT